MTATYARLASAALVALLAWLCLELHQIRSHLDRLEARDVLVLPDYSCECGLTEEVDQPD